MITIYFFYFFLLFFFLTICCFYLFKFFSSIEFFLFSNKNVSVQVLFCSVIVSVHVCLIFVVVLCNFSYKRLVDSSHSTITYNLKSIKKKMSLLYMSKQLNQKKAQKHCLSFILFVVLQKKKRNFIIILFIM